MTRTDIRNWLLKQFDPVKLATPPQVIDQIIENAIRYWNVHSAYRIVRMYPAYPGIKRVQVSPEYKDVVEIFPATGNSFLFNSNPLWTMLGITIIDNITQDLILLGESYRNYRYYIGNDFRFSFEPPEDSFGTAGGYIYLVNLPVGCTAVAVVGTKRISNVFAAASVTNDTLTWTRRTGDTIDVIINGVRYPNISVNVATLAEVAANINTAVGSSVATIIAGGFLKITSPTTGFTSQVAVNDSTTGNSGAVGKLFSSSASRYATGTGDPDIHNEYILEWLLEYAQALLKIAEGRLLRKADIIGVHNDGGTFVDEGEASRKELEAKLSVDGRWVALASRG